MNKNYDLKEKLLNQIQDILDKRIETATRDIELAKESRDSETKSSVGDKYETGRAMVQFEIEKHNLQLQKAQQQKHELSQINLHKNYKFVEFGSLVFTSLGNYFISIGLGKIDIKTESFYCISMASPIGKILYKKKVGEKIIFQGKEIDIVDIL